MTLRRAILLGVATGMLASCADGNVERRPMPGVAFGPDFEAMRRQTLQPIRLRQPIRRPALSADGFRPARKTAAAPQIVEAVFPTILSKVDTQLYLRAFAAQRRRQWAESDRFLRAVTNKVLVGTLLKHRYLNGYEATFTELSAWLSAYSDEDGADRIFRLAVQRKPAGAALPAKPAARVRRAVAVPPEFERSPKLPGKPALSAEDASEAAALRRQITSALTGIRLNRASELLNGKATRLLGAARADALRARLGHAFLQRGRFESAWKVSAPASIRSARHVSLAPWIAGLSAWALDRWPEAAEHFERLAKAGNDHEWLIAASAYWAGRSHAKAGDAASANHWFGKAATFRRTFYGLLARARLNLPSAFDWRKPAADPMAFKAFVDSAAGKRIIALVQIGAYELAGQSLLSRYFQQAEAQAETYLTIALAGRMPATAFRIADRMARRDGRQFDIALFPTPVWQPRRGFRRDRALVFAVMRQESAFRPAAISHAGARGLMQIMPATARFTARLGRVPFEGVWRLFDPQFNILLGDSFLAYLLARPTINGNLLFAVAAYNAGEGNLARWSVRSDPLLFTEAIYFRETRIYVERVMYNLWAYRARLGQAAPSLKALAADTWPRYVPLDPKVDR